MFQYPQAKICPSGQNISITPICILLLCHSIGQLILPTQPVPREEDDYPRSGKYPKHVPLPVYFAYVQSTGTS